MATIPWSELDGSNILDEDEIVGNYTHDRHPSLVDLCGRLERILVGRAAARLLESPEALPEHGGLWVAPMWSWVFSRIHVGRKDRAGDGSRFRLPIRAEWSAGEVVVVTEKSAVLQEWTTAGLGHSGLGVTEVRLADVETDQMVREETGLPISVALPRRSRRELVSRLTEMVEDAKRAHWESLAWIEPFVERALTNAHAAVSNELQVNPGRFSSVLDETKLKMIADHMLLGDDSHQGKVSLLLEKCLAPSTFVRCEPVRYIKEALRRDANNEVRRALGDPHIGTKVRAIARLLGPRANIDQVVEEYRRQYPSDRLSHARASAALSVAPDAMAGWSDLSLEAR